MSRSWRVGEPCWEVQRERNGRWVALGIWPADPNGEASARGYLARCQAVCATVRLIQPNGTEAAD